MLGWRQLTARTDEVRCDPGGRRAAGTTPWSEFSEGVQYGVFAMRVTHSVRLLQDLMPRGDTTAWQPGVLGALALAFLILTVVLLILTVVLLRRTMRSA